MSRVPNQVDTDLKRFGIIEKTIHWIGAIVYILAGDLQDCTDWSD